MEQANEPKIFNVPEENLAVLQERIAKLNKRAKKLGCDFISVNILGSKEVPIRQHDELGFEADRIVGYRKVYEITVYGAAPKINGWEFIAVIQPTMDEAGVNLGNILRGVPGATHEVPEAYRKAENHCDHCNTIRRRNETFVLRHDDDTYKQVGRNCLRDFLGHTSPETLAAIAQMLIDAEDFGYASENDGFGGRATPRYVAEEVLRVAACAIRLNGWRSNKTAREFGSESTSMNVSAWINARADERKKWEKPLIVSDEDKATAAEVVEWLSKLQERTELNDYMYNLSILGQGATFTSKNFGLACSAIPTYLREMEREINRRKQFEDDAKSVHVGTVGVKFEGWTLTLVHTMDFESDWGVSHMYKFKDEAGNVVVWFSSNVYFNDAAGRDINVGDTVVLSGSVKKHETYNGKGRSLVGVQQTIVTRCKTYKSKEQKKAEAKARKDQRDKMTAAGCFDPTSQNYRKNLDEIAAEVQF